MFFLETNLLNSLKDLFAKYAIEGKFAACEKKIYDMIFISNKGFKIYIEARQKISAYNIERHKSTALSLRQEGNYFLLVTQNISQKLQDVFEDSAIMYFSPDGAAKIEIPGFCYIIKLLNRKKQKTEGTSGTVFTGKAVWIPRWFFANPQKECDQKSLSTELKISRAYSSILVREMLQKEYIIENNDKYILYNADKMLDDWEKVYRFDRYKKKKMFAMNFSNVKNGAQNLSAQLNAFEVRHAFMGSSGAFLRAPYMETSLLTLYVDKIPEYLDGVYPVEKDGNVIMYIPANDGYFIGCNNINNIPVVSDVQLYLDLKKMPGRSEDLADYLRDTKMNWSENA